jgi:hypothetical protein
MNNTRIGTCHFVSERAAISYYEDQETDAASVREKIKEGAICIGPPHVEEGERLVTIEQGRRYAIETF